MNESSNRRSRLRCVGREFEDQTFITKQYSAIKCKNIVGFYKAPGRASPASKVWTWIYICCGDGHVDLKLIRCGMVIVRRVDNEYKQKTCQRKNLLNQPETEENTQKKNNPQNKTGTAL